MKNRIRVGLQVLTAANTGIGHDGAAAAWFEGCWWPAISPTAGTRSAIESVIGAKLVTDFVRHVVDIKGICNRVTGTRFSLGLERGKSNYTQISQPAAFSAKDMANVVVVVANHGIQIRLVIAQKRRSVTGVIGVS